jgi:hypothetical protein
VSGENSLKLSLNKKIDALHSQSFNSTKVNFAVLLRQ